MFGYDIGPSIAYAELSITFVSKGIDKVQPLWYFQAEKGHLNNALRRYLIRVDVSLSQRGPNHNNVRARAPATRCAVPKIKRSKSGAVATAQ